MCNFSVCAWNISGIAELIRTKFTRKTCLVPLSDAFECQGQKSKVGDLRAVNVWKNIFAFALVFCLCVKYLGNRWTDLRIKFTQKTCLVPRSNEFEVQGQFPRPACGLCLEKRLCSSSSSVLGHYIYVLLFLLSSSSLFFLFFSPILCGLRLDVYYTSAYDVALVII